MGVGQHAVLQGGRADGVAPDAGAGQPEQLAVGVGQAGKAGLFAELTDQTVISSKRYTYFNELISMNEIVKLM